MLVSDNPQLAIEMSIFLKTAQTRESRISWPHHIQKIWEKLHGASRTTNSAFNVFCWHSRYRFGLKKIRGKNIASEKSCGFLLWETSVDMGGSSFKNATSTQLQNQFIGRYSNITWSLPLIISRLIVLWVPTWWRNMSSKLPRSSEYRHHLDLVQPPQS